MKSITKIILLFFGLFITSQLMFAQTTKTISGKITDIQKNPIIGASVIEKGTSNGTITNMDGNYTLKVSSKAKTISISYIGYQSQSIEIGKGNSVDVVLEENSHGLDEVVVVGYGSTKKSDLTGSISSVKMADMPKAATSTVPQMLKGQVAGMSFSQYSTQPGAKVTMNIRGTATGASPLVVIDGFPVSPMAEPDDKTQFLKGDKEDVLDNINPEDIENIQILKDASATSIYGSRAAGGVILITTKRGSKDKVNVTMKYSYTSQKMVENWNILSPQQFMTEVNKSILEKYVAQQGYYPWGEKPLPSYNNLVAEFMNSNSGSPYGGFRYDPNTINSFTGGTNWLDAVTRMGSISQYDLSVNGGNDKTRYSISLGNMADKGIAKNNDYSRTSGRINLDQEFNSWLKGGMSVSYSATNSTDLAFSNPNGDVQGVFDAARSFDPTLSIKDAYGNYTQNIQIGYAKNPASILDVSLLSKKENLLTTAFIEMKPFKELIIKGTAGYNRKTATTDSYLPSTTYEGASVNGNATKNFDEQTDFLLNTTATFSKVFNKKHSVTLMGGWEYQRFERDGFNAGNTGFPYDGVLWNNLGLGTNAKPTVGSYGGFSENASAIARLNYGYDNRYLLTVNYRLDGSSNFAQNKQWGNFGGASVAWRINEEAFLKDKVDWLSNLKLRAGAGVTGYAGTLTGTRTYYASGYGFDYYFNNVASSGIGLKTIGNPDLSWESQQDLNIGLDFGFLNNRINGSIDVYERTINNRIGSLKLMTYQEVNTIAANTQRVDKTQGIDFNLGALIIKTDKFKWDAQFTCTFYRDMTVKRDPSEVLDINNFPQYQWNDMWSFVSDGLVKPGEALPGQPSALAGSVKIKDLDGYKRDASGNKVYDSNGKPEYLGHPDGKIDNADLVFFGNNTPIPFSLSNTFSYKGFDMNIFVYGKFNQRKSNDYKSYADQVSIYNGSNGPNYIMNRMSFDNLDSQIPSFEKGTGGFGAGNYYLEDAWFVRLDNISVGYTLDKKITKKLLQSVRFSLAARNIFVLTPFKGPDPEFSVYTYPEVRSLTLGIDVKF